MTQSDDSRRKRAPGGASKKGFGQHLAFGRSGEARAATWYTERGYSIVERNWRCREGEVDLIACHNGELVFCEVKTRSSDRYGTPAEAVSWTKQRKLRVLAAIFMHALPSDDPLRRCAIRFDVAGVTPQNIDVIEHAF